MVFRLEAYKWTAAVTEIKRMNGIGRPILVGTTSVERSDQLSDMLKKAGIKHQVGPWACLSVWVGSVVSGSYFGFRPLNVWPEV